MWSKRIFGKKRRMLSLMLTFTIIVGLFAGINTGIRVQASSDVYDLLENKDVTVLQGNPAVIVNAGGDLAPDEDIEFKFSFDVPIKGDFIGEDPQPDYVEGGDYAVFNFPNDLVVSNTTEAAMFVEFTEGEPVQVATAYIDNDKVTFQFDNNLDNDVYSGCSVEFTAEMTFDLEGTDYAEGNYELVILEKTYYLEVPDDILDVSGSKTGTLMNNKVRWMVEVTSEYDSNPAPLQSYLFSDDLSSVGELVADSVKIGTSDNYEAGTSVALTMDDDNNVTDSEYSYSGNVITYEFPDGAEGTRYIFFDTIIDDTKLFGTGQQTVSNKARVRNDANTKTFATFNAVTDSFTPQWITKTGVASNEGSSGSYNTDDRVITWTVEANLEGRTLTDVSITDLMSGVTGSKGGTLAFVSATMSVFDPDLGDSGEYVDTPVGSEPVGGVYNFTGTIDSKIKLVIVSEVVSNADPDTVEEFTNAAVLDFKLDGVDKSVNSENIGVNIGFNPISKNSGSYNASTHEQAWDIELSTQGLDYDGNLRILDMVVYGDTFSPGSYSITGGSNVGLLDISKTDIDNISNKGYKQQFVESSVTTSAGLSYTIHTIIDDGSGKAIAEVLVITGTNGIGIDHTVDNHTVEFNTMIMDPDVYAKHGSTTIYNYADLFSDGTLKASNNASKSVTSRMLRKDTLKRDNAEDLELDISDFSNLNTNGGNTGAYDYIDNAVYFRIHVNANNLKDATNDVTQVDGETVGDFTILDELPENWAFKKIDGDKDYLLYTATATGSGGKVNATGLVTDDSGIIDAGAFSVTAPSGSDGGRMSWTFTSLTQPYMLLVKAGPITDNENQVIKGYFDNNTDTNLTNKVTMSTASTSNVNATTTVKIESDILQKRMDTSKANSDAYLTWEVEYNPYDLEGNGATRLEDILPEGIDLRTDATGDLIYTGNIILREMTMGIDGQLTVGAAVTPVEDYVTYDRDSRTMTLNFPDSSTPYLLTYITDITGEIGLSLSNVVELYINDETVSAGNNAYVVSDSAHSASLTRAGYVKINKTKNNGGDLEGAEFTLFAADGTTPIRKAVTNDDGIAYLTFIPEGSYILKETSAAAGYQLLDETFEVLVGVVGSNFVTIIDGDETNDLNVINYQEGNFGSLIIEKTVAGQSGDETKAFEFTVTLSGTSDSYEYYGTGVDDGTITSGDKISLAHNQSIKIVGIPMNTPYSVVETDYSGDGYETESTGASGTIVVDDTVTASFTNTRNVGNLIIRKTVAGNGGDETKAFEFTVTLSGTSGSFEYQGTGVDDGTITSGDKVSLAHNQSIEIVGLPMNTPYSVVETDYTVEGYVTESSGASGTIVVEDTVTASFTNTRNVGDLIIQKAVAGNGANEHKTFEFTVTFEGAAPAYTYEGTGVAGGSIASGDKVYLTHGQSIKIIDLPAGAAYSVTEEDYTSEGYITSSTAATGTISTDSTVNAVFVNAKDVGSLQISKSVTGNGRDTEKDFDFTVTFSETARTFDYVGVNVDNGTISSGDTITLAHGQSIIITGLPVDMTYSIAEEDYSGEGYETSATGDSGVIAEDMIHEAAFINHRQVGNLLISKTVDNGSESDLTKAFEFTVTFSDTDAVYNYIGTGVADGTVTSGDTFELSHEQSIEIQNILAGTTYQVVEADYSADRFNTSYTNASGTIQAEETAEAGFINRKRSSGGGSSVTTTVAETTTTQAPTTTTATTTTTEVPTTTEIVAEVTTENPFFVKETTTTTEVPTTTTGTTLPGTPEPSTEAPQPTTVPEPTYPEEIIFKPNEDVEEVEVKEEPEKGTVEITEEGDIVYIPGPDFDGTDRLIVVVTTPDGDEEEIIIDIFEELPEAGLPATGGIPTDIFIGFGTILLGTGLGLRMRKRK